LTAAFAPTYDRSNSDAFAAAFLAGICIDFNEWLSLKEGYGVRARFASFRFFRASASPCPSLDQMKAEPLA
jgi:hypothetical protein